MAEKKFTFTHDGKTYELPPYVDSVPKVPGGVVSDLLMNPSRQNEMALQVHALEVSEASDEARAALRSMSAGDLFTVLGDWMGESAGS